MTDKLAALTAYLSQRSGEAAYGLHQYWANHLLPPVGVVTEQDVDALARYLLEDVEFQAINLGSWLGTTEGRIAAAAVEQALPFAYRPYTHLFVEALRRAAQLQHAGKQEQAKPWLAVAAAGIAMIGWLVFGGNGG